MLYPLSYEGVPIQYKAPRTTRRHHTSAQPTTSHLHPRCAYVPARALPALHPNPCSPPCVHRLRTPAPGGRTTPTMYE